MSTADALHLGYVYVQIPATNEEPPRHEMVRYDQFVRRLFKAMPEKDMKFHAALGVAGEAGELADVIKRELIYNSPLTSDKKPIREGIIEELGDLAFYVQSVKQMYGISDHEILQANADKLCKRYVDLAYSDTHANARMDKQIEVPQMKPEVKE